MLPCVAKRCRYHRKKTLVDDDKKNLCPALQMFILQDTMSADASYATLVSTEEIDTQANRPREKARLDIKSVPSETQTLCCVQALLAACRPCGECGQAASGHRRRRRWWCLDGGMRFRGEPRQSWAGQSRL